MFSATHTTHQEQKLQMLLYCTLCLKLLLYQNVNKRLSANPLFLPRSDILLSDIFLDFHAEPNIHKDKNDKPGRESGRWRSRK